jgi:hypothetical protein
MLRFTNLVLGFATFYLASALPGGAPPEACSTLTPSHSRDGTIFFPQTTVVPYEINLSVFDVENGSYVYVPGRTYTLTFEDPDANGLQFRGFFIQSRLTADMMTLVGEFIVTDSGNSQLRPCPANGDPNGITHTNRNDKDSVSMQWTAPPEGTGPIQFAYAAVQVLDTFWANERSEMLQEGAAALAVSTLGLLLSLGAVLLF